ncbi:MULTISPECIES: glycosyltransferase [unclassified Gordonia (in: high G+C Gram-positive bacteria)]|uniref:glycosyltransferase n=1 Tax=unclassified Gordonia (in: high G+C Gram-positive bacteria) TaxID=2657482 RepID=UPI00071C3D03|nr:MULTISPECIES: glycosyltransferase [unclassified Gordonia (in: high G+C Gram-positive bacteria)]KSU53906.1 glycosyl transferase [Gordonia sp. SGD-V-85]SCC55487.1 Glycosyltransferase involved in cell wall bisynthesis [Gordonia sp. v-85]
MRSAELADTTDSVETVSISVLVPSFDPGAHFEPAIRSALRQLGPHDEIVIQDAGSTDGTQDLIAALAETDPRVKAVIEADEGQSDALNRALARATGQWVLWLNADDVLVEGALVAIRAAVRESPGATVLTGDHQLLRAAGDVVGTYRGKPIETRTLLRRSTCASFSGSVIIRRDYLESLGGFDAHLHCTMDYSLQFRIAETAPVQQSMPVPIGALRFHDASKSANLWRTFLVESFRLRLRYATSPTERLLGLLGTAEQLVSFLVFRIRLTPGYRRLRGVLRD